MIWKHSIYHHPQSRFVQIMIAYIAATMAGVVDACQVMHNYCSFVWDVVDDYCVLLHPRRHHFHCCPSILYYYSNASWISYLGSSNKTYWGEVSVSAKVVSFVCCGGVLCPFGCCGMTKEMRILVRWYGVWEIWAVCSILCEVCYGTWTGQRAQSVFGMIAHLAWLY